MQGILNLLSPAMEEEKISKGKHEVKSFTNFYIIWETFIDSDLMLVPLPNSVSSQRKRCNHVS